MRDIGARIQRYRLSRYGSPAAPILRRLRWALPFLGLWLAYATLFSEHSLLRVWRLGGESGRTQADLDRTRGEIERLEAQMKDPAVRRRQGERLLREQSGFARPGEIIYRIPASGTDSLGR